MNSPTLPLFGNTNRNNQARLQAAPARKVRCRLYLYTAWHCMHVFRRLPRGLYGKTQNKMVSQPPPPPPPPPYHHHHHHHVLCGLLHGPLKYYTIQTTTYKSTVGKWLHVKKPKLPTMLLVREVGSIPWNSMELSMGFHCTCRNRTLQPSIGVCRYAHVPRGWFGQVSL